MNQTACRNTNKTCSALAETYTVLGPWLIRADELVDPSHLSLKLSVDGQVRQNANTNDLIIDVPGLIAFASRFYNLMPGDVLLTGTPEGVGPRFHTRLVHLARSDGLTMGVMILGAVAMQANLNGKSF
jgi:2,4-didehydro-3-deoxy-L-rhamnonate hydrolase